ncbi:MAG: EF-hand domain-containing protein [Amphiplicatus sp.]
MKRLHAATIILGLGLMTAPAFAGERGDKMWDKMDKDGDGQIALSELNDRSRAFFEAADANGDGAITKEEMKAHHEAKRAEREAKRFPDADGDGVVSKAEYDAKADERFAKLDANGDGVLSEEEMKTGHHRGGNHGGGPGRK